MEFLVSEAQICRSCSQGGSLGDSITPSTLHVPGNPVNMMVSINGLSH